MKNKTIVALATPPMNGAIHIIRISGDNAFNLVNRICSNKITRKGYEIQKTNILDNNKIIDHVLINKFVAPKSFTGEDLVEINCHGGYYLASKIIELLIKYGCVLALPGEFTQRAYMNGKLLLHEAEAINNLINATSDRGIELANNGLNDGAINKLKKFRSDLFQLIAQVEINIDYPEFDDAPNMSIKKMNETIHSLINFATKVINDSTKIIPIIEGINIVIIGKPNVGKSSILNSIISKNRVIVSDTPGTTRDIITIPINLKGVTVNFLDTAGLRKTKNKIEQIGVNKTHEMMQKANLILWIIDGSSILTKDDLAIQKLLNNKKYIVVINKSDLPQKANIKGIKISALKNKIKPLIDELLKALKFQTNIPFNQVMLQSTRSISNLKNVVNELQDALKLINNKQPIDLTIEYLHAALENINHILGDFKCYDFVNEMFRKFCVGK